tara:strand:+ start:1288 stop:1632 length:345 start_codon:yes stop_codon:yes gene_type:complete
MNLRRSLRRLRGKSTRGDYREMIIEALEKLEKKLTRKTYVGSTPPYISPAVFQAKVRRVKRKIPRILVMIQELEEINDDSRNSSLKDALTAAEGIDDDHELLAAIEKALKSFRK